MSTSIDTFLGQNNVTEALNQCIRESQYNLGDLLGSILTTNNTECDNKVGDVEITCESTKILLMCNWANIVDIRELWNKYSKGNYKWNNITLVESEPTDYYVVLNAPPQGTEIDLARTIYFQMDPDNSHFWGIWSNPPIDKLFFCGTHDRHYNTTEWHLSKTHEELSTEVIAKTKDNLSVVLDNSYRDIGQIKKVDFVKFLESKEFPIEVYGGEKFHNTTYKGEIQDHNSNDAMIQYKYLLAVENKFTNGYFSEKLIDGILSECLVFYCGAPDIKNYIDERAFVSIDLLNQEANYAKIRNAIESNMWADRLQYIQEAKKKILNEMSFFPRIEKIIG